MACEVRWGWYWTGRSKQQSPMAGGILMAQGDGKSLKSWSQPRQGLTQGTRCSKIDLFSFCWLGSSHPMEETIGGDATVR